MASKSSIKYMSLYPTMQSVDNVVAKAMSEFPEHLHNQVQVLLATYHNTLIAQLERETNLVMRK